MRIISIITAVVVMATLYAVVFERDRLLALASNGSVEEDAAMAETGTAVAPAGAPEDVVSVVAQRSVATEVDSAVLVRGRTEAARQVDVRAETTGQVVSEPLRKGSSVEAGALMCRIDPGTRNVSLAEAKARLGEAKSRLPEAEARLAEAIAALPAAEARIAEAEARVPEAKARLAEAEANVPAVRALLAQSEAGVPAAEAQLLEARARLPEAQARVVEAEARVKEAMINLNAAQKLSEDGFASSTRLASSEAATEAARAGVQSAKSQAEGANAGVQAALSALEGAKASVESSRSQVEGAKAAIASAKSQVEGAEAGVISAKSGLQGAKAAITSAESGVESAKAGIQSAETSVASAEKEIERLEIHAPFAGLLESDSAELGSLLQAGSLCATVIQLNPIKLVGFIPETEVDRVNVGSPAGARLASGREVTGNVTFLSRSADPSTRTFRVEIEVDNSDLSIRDGQTVEIGIASDGAKAHLIPSSALTLNDEGTIGVRTIDPESRAAFSPIIVLRDTSQGIWVGGLDEEVEVIVVGQEYVTDGVAVEPTFREATQ